MAVLLASTTAVRDPLSEAYFTRAADSLSAHRSGDAGSCTGCEKAWPCGSALAAAFLLDIHGG